MSVDHVIAIGASAGGHTALSSLLTALADDIPAAICIVVHRPSTDEDMLAEYLQQKTHWKIIRPQNGEALRRGVAYVAPADRHLILQRDRLKVVYGALENQWRPAIDPLFRSAAIAYGAGAIGVLLSGFLDDGTAGLAAIKRCGGTTVVQDPADADFPAMPRTAILAGVADHCVRVEAMPRLLNELMRRPIGESPAVPEDIISELKFVETEFSVDDDGSRDGAPTHLSCPVCSGPLWLQKDKTLTHFRCLVGHSFGLRPLQEEAHDALERALWTAIRMLEQRRNILRLLADQEHRAGRAKSCERYTQRSKEAAVSSVLLRRLQAQIAAEGIGAAPAAS